MAVQKVTFFPGQRIQYSLDYSSTTLLEKFISTERRITRRPKLSLMQLWFYGKHFVTLSLNSLWPYLRKKNEDQND